MKQCLEHWTWQRVREVHYLEKNTISRRLRDFCDKYDVYEVEDDYELQPDDKRIEV